MKNFKTYGQFIAEAYSDEERRELADKGFALSDGSFPIKDLKDLKNAIQAYGRAKDQARAAKFIVKRAKALGAEDLIPDTEDFQKSLGESKLNESEVGRLMILIDDGATDAEILKEFPKLNAGDLAKWYNTFIDKDLAAGMKSKDLGESKLTEAKDDYVARYKDTNINLKKGYKHLNDEELNQLYLEIGELISANKLKVKDATLQFESSVNEAFKFSEKEVKDIAELIAKAIAKVDNMPTAVHDMEFDKGRGAGFEISIDGEKYDGGSYVVRPNGDVVNSAIGNSFPNAIYAKIGDKDINKVMKNIQKFESTAYTQVPAKTIAITEGTDLGGWNQGGPKGNQNVLITQYVGPKDIEDLGMGRKCIQINVGRDYVQLNPADIIELQDILKSYKVK